MKKREIFLLDTLWANIVKSKANYHCEHCKIAGIRMEAAHVVGRRHRATRWGCYLDGVNYDLCGHCLCHGCHQHYDEHGPLEDKIIRETINPVRKSLIQIAANKLVGKDQDYDSIKCTLEDYGRNTLERTVFERMVESKAKAKVCKK